MGKLGRPHDDSDLPPKRDKAQRAREADLFALMRATTDTQGLDRELEAEMRIVRSNREALKKSTLRPSDRDLLIRQTQIRLERIKTLTRLKG